MKKILLLLFLFFIKLTLFAQVGADITGLVKINGIQENNNNIVLTTDGNGNLGYLNLSSLSNVETVQQTLVNTSGVKVQIVKDAKFRNLPYGNYNRVITIDSNGALGYRNLQGVSTSSANFSGTLGLSSQNVINLTANIFNAPNGYEYIVVVDNNGVLGKRPLSEFRVPYFCQGWQTLSSQTDPWVGCDQYTYNNQQRLCYNAIGETYTENQTVTTVDNTGCTPTHIPNVWEFNGYGAITCINSTSKNRVNNWKRTITYKNGTTGIEYSSTNETIPNNAPVSGFTYLQNLLQFEFKTTHCTALGGANPVCNTYSYDPDGDAISYFWEFGDGNTSTQENVSYNYAQPGNYNVKLTITDACGAKSSVTIPINATCNSISNIQYVNISETHRQVTQTFTILCGSTALSTSTVKNQYREIIYKTVCHKVLANVIENCAQSCFTNPATGGTTCTKSNCVYTNVYENECNQVADGYTNWHD